MSQESTKEPAFEVEVGCVCGAAICLKKVRKITDASKLAPMTSLTFFSLLRKLAEQALRIAALVWMAKVSAVFLWKNERG